jgi:hypothetical protein
MKGMWRAWEDFCYRHPVLLPLATLALASLALIWSLPWENPVAVAGGLCFIAAIVSALWSLAWRVVRWRILRKMAVIEAELATIEAAMRRLDE